MRASLKLSCSAFIIRAADVTRKEVYYPVDQRIKLRVDPDLQARRWALCSRDAAAAAALPLLLCHCSAAALPPLCCCCCAAAAATGLLLLLLVAVACAWRRAEGRRCACVDVSTAGSTAERAHGSAAQPSACPSPVPQELWLSIGEQLPDEEDELQEALQQIGGWRHRQRVPWFGPSKPAWPEGQSRAPGCGQGRAAHAAMCGLCPRQASSPRRGRFWRSARRGRKSARRARCGASPRSPTCT